MGIPLLDIGLKLLDKVLPDPAARDAAKLQLATLQQNGELEELKTQVSVILAEASSADPWTSRARPSFLYVVYILILSSIPMGIVYAISPETAQHITDGFKAWLESIPEPMLELFGVVMLGYIGGRSFEKVKGAAK